MKNNKRAKSYPSTSPSELAAKLGVGICALLGEEHRTSLGQFFTPPEAAKLLAGMFNYDHREIRLLDPGAGAGSLTAAFVEELIKSGIRPRTLHLTAWEIEKTFHPALDEVLQSCVELATSEGIETTYRLNSSDFLADAVDILDSSLISSKRKLFETPSFTHAILNPPYKKISASSPERSLIRSADLETSNLYTGFLWMVTRLLGSGGEMVAITPRSFANGPYFLPFRKQFFAEMSLQRVHVFEKRNSLFSRDKVLQENVILNATRVEERPQLVRLTSSTGDKESAINSREVQYDRVIDSTQGNHILHLSLTDFDESVGNKMREMPCSLADLGIAVSTGRVVDFRARDHLRRKFESGCVPLIYASHFNSGGVSWPKDNSKKPNAIVASDETRSLLVPNSTYVLVKRFTSKEEKRRVVASVFEAKGSLKKFSTVGFENHLNYFYCQRGQMDDDQARGLAIYLNSSLVDSYFRQFSGHTQVNATDLKALRYPTSEQLRQLASKVVIQHDQSSIDSGMAAML